MKPRPPLEIFIAAMVVFFLGGWLLADMVVSHGDPQSSFPISFIFIAILGFGILQGWLFSHGWIMVLSGLAALTLLPVLWVSILPAYLAPTPGEDPFIDLVSYMVFPVSGLLVFICVRRQAAREWCKAGGQNPKVSLTLGGLACLLGLLVAVPVKIEEQMQKALVKSIYPICTEFTFQSKDEKPILSPVFFQGETMYPRAEEYSPKITQSSTQNPDGSTRILIGGLANRPVMVEFAAPGYEMVNFLVTNKCPQSITLTLQPAKAKVTAAK